MAYALDINVIRMKTVVFSLLFIISLNVQASEDEESDYSDAYIMKKEDVPKKVSNKPEPKKRKLESTKRQPGERSDKSPPWEDEDLEENLH